MIDTTICICPHCGTKNRIPNEKLEDTAKCGRCHKAFSPQTAAKAAEQILTLRCGNCRTKNRVPAGKLNAGPKCGRCGSLLQNRDLLTGRSLMVTDANFNETVLKSPLPVLLYGWAPWCSVCGSTTPQVEQLASETKGKIRVAKVNIDANPTLANKYNILSVPSFLIFDAGEFKTLLPGAVPKHDLMMQMAKFI